MTTSRSKQLFVMHFDDEPAVEIVDGIRYEVLPGEPFEFDIPLHMHVFITNQWYRGVVEVPYTSDRTGIRFDLETAERNAREALEIADKRVIRDYITTQQEDRLRKNFPALPPGGRAARLIKKYGVSLERYGIIPVGADDFGRASGNGGGGGAAGQQQAISNLTAIDGLRKQNEAQQAIINRLIKSIGAVMPEAVEGLVDELDLPAAEKAQVLANLGEEPDGLESQPLPTEDDLATAHATEGAAGPPPPKGKTARKR